MTIENKPLNISTGSKKNLFPSKSKLSSKPAMALVPKTTEEIYGKYKENMEEDKVTLMKRLNAILLQLDAATAEKATMGKSSLFHSLSLYFLEKQLEANVSRVLELEHLIDQDEASKERYDTNLREEITYERELNSKLTRDLKKYENDRDMLRDTIIPKGKDFKHSWSAKTKDYRLRQ